MATFAAGPCFCPQADFLNGRRPGLLNRQTQLGLRHLVAVAHKLSSHAHGKVTRMLRLHS